MSRRTVVKEAVDPNARVYVLTDLGRQALRDAEEEELECAVVCKGADARCTSGSCASLGLAPERRTPKLGRSPGPQSRTG
jgi:hypothetical protein